MLLIVMMEKVKSKVAVVLSLSTPVLGTFLANIRLKTRCNAAEHSSTNRSVASILSLAGGGGGGEGVRSFCPATLDIALRKLHRFFDNRFKRIALQQ